jgi:hypothetical protein
MNTDYWHRHCNLTYTQLKERLDKRMIQEEIIEMASLSSKYLTDHNQQISEEKKAGSEMFEALVYSIGVDTTSLLIATEIGIDRLPVMHSLEAEA